MSDKPLPDIQAGLDDRGIAIDRVGVSDLEYPIHVMDRDGNPIPVSAKVSMSVHLPHHFKGTHMSRFLEVLAKHEGEVRVRRGAVAERREDEGRRDRELPLQPGLRRSHGARRRGCRSRSR